MHEDVLGRSRVTPANPEEQNKLILARVIARLSYIFRFFMISLVLGLGTLTSRNSKFKLDVLSNSQSKFMMK